jgi:hypothetical protein
MAGVFGLKSGVASGTCPSARRGYAASMSRTESKAADRDGPLVSPIVVKGSSAGAHEVCSSAAPQAAPARLLLRFTVIGTP